MNRGFDSQLPPSFCAIFTPHYDFRRVAPRWPATDQAIADTIVYRWSSTIDNLRSLVSGGGQVGIPPVCEAGGVAQLGHMPSAGFLRFSGRNAVSALPNRADRCSLNRGTSCRSVRKPERCIGRPAHHSAERPLCPRWTIREVVLAIARPSLLLAPASCPPCLARSPLA